MKIVSMVVAFAFTAIPILAATLPADARARDHIHYGYCKSMKRVNNIKNCREFGGTR